MKKLKKYIKFFLVGSIWTYIFLCLADFLFTTVWRFDIFSREDWKIISQFWNSGGKIKNARDYLFLFSFLFGGILWVWGFRRCMKLNFAAILLYPFEAYSRWSLKRYGDTSRIVIKNIGSTGEKVDPKEIVKMKLKEVEKEIDTNKETKKIREIIADKISDK